MSETLTIRLKAETKAKLEKLAAATKRSKAYLAAEAIEAYIAQELPIVEGILHGIEDADAGRLIPHKEVMAHLRKVVRTAAKAKAKHTEKA